MTESADHFETEFKPHSKHKHLIFKTYLDAWLRKLSLGDHAHDKLFIVDAFAGAGSDAAGNPGSPVLAARAASDAVKQLRSQFGRHVDVELIAIEKDPSCLARLGEALSEFPHVRILSGTFEQHLPEIQREIADSPALYFVDPFGVSLRGELILDVLAKPKNEVFLLFADQAALRHFGVISANETRATQQLRKHDDRPPSFFPDMETAERKRLEEQAKRSERSLATTKVAAIRILDAALRGSHWLARVEAAPAAERRRAFLRLYGEMLLEQAKRVLEIPMVNEDGVHIYSLLHATKSARGYVTMKEAVEYALARSPLPAGVLDDMKLGLRVQLEPVARLVLERYAGQQIRWAESKSDRSAPAVRRTVLEDTEIYPFQLAELKERLKQYRLPGQAIQYKLP